MRNAEIELDFGDGRYVFRLGWQELIALQEKTDCGPFFLQQRFGRGDWRVQDIEETIRQGLIGGGMAPVAATKLVKLYVHNRPLLEEHGPLETAQATISAALIGHPDEPTGEASRASPESKGNGSTIFPTDAGGLPASSEAAPPSESPSASS